MIFFASVQLSLSVMGLIPMSEGLSLMDVTATTGTAGCGTSGTVGRGGIAEMEGGAEDAEESEEVGINEPAIEETTEALPDGSWVVEDEERWVRM